MGGFVCAAHRRKNRGFPTLKRTLDLGTEKGRLFQNSRPNVGGIYKIFFCSDARKPLILLGFSKSSVSPLAPEKSSPLDCFFSEINPCGFVKYAEACEIWLRHVKCAAARGDLFHFT